MKLRTLAIAAALAGSVPAFADAKKPAEEKELKEEKIRVEDVPAAVMKAFAAKYAGAKATKAEKVTTDKGINYELAWMDGKKKREATFHADGTFVEEE